MHSITINRAICFVLSFVMLLVSLCQRSFSQQITPLKSGSTILLEFNSKGQLKKPPIGFSLLDEGTYTLHIVVDNPKGQLSDLFNYVKEKCAKSLIKLEDPTSTYADVYRTLWGEEDFDSLVNEIKEMKSILESPDPKAAFDRSRNNFFYFMGRTFLENNLFTARQVVTTSLDNQEENVDFASTTIDFNRTITASNGKLKVSVFISDVKKEFLKSYFETGRRRLRLPNSIKPPAFYKFITPQLKDIVAQSETFIKELDGIAQSRDSIICDESLYNRYKNFIKQSNDNELMWLLQNDWIKEWVWFNEGDIALSPLGFTDEELLDLREGPVQYLADTFNLYRDSAISAMIHSTQLNESKINYHVFDSLLAQKGKGASIYTYKDSNQVIINQNAAKAKEVQKFFSSLNAINFKVEELQQENPSILLSFNQAQQLKAGTQNRLDALTKDARVTAYVYNLKMGSTIFLKETSESIPDQSAAIKGLNEALDAGKVLQDNVPNMTGVVSDLVRQLSGSKSEVLPLGIGAKHLLGFIQHDAFEKKGHPRLPAFDYFEYKIGFDSNNQPFAYEALGNDSTKIMLSFMIDGIIILKVGHDCPFLRQLVLAKLKLAEVKERVHTVALSYYLNELIGSTANRLKASFVLEQMQVLKEQAKCALALSYKPSFLHLPPTRFKPETDTSTGFTTAWQEFEDQEKPVLVKAKLYTIGTTGKDTLATKKISIKRSATHWISASLGVGYIWNRFRSSDASYTDGAIINPRNEDQVRLLAGLHFYIVPILLTDDRAIWNMKTGKELASRFSFFLGVSFPQPLNNLHFGGALDIWPGVKITGGIHLNHYTKYKILNNQLIDQKSTYLYNGAFLGLTLEPLTFAKLIGLFK